MFAIRFAKSLNFFQPSEVTFEGKLDDNPIYPFTPVLLTPLDQDPVFRYTRRLSRFYYALGICVIMTVISIILGNISSDLEILYVPLMLVFVSLLLIVEGVMPQTLVIDVAQRRYSVYRGPRLTESNHCHNIYIRILSRPGSQTFWAVLNAVNLESPIKLSYETKNKKKLRMLCKKLAANLSINYFDVHNHSKHHVIRHRKPQSHAYVTAASSVHPGDVKGHMHVP